EEEEARKYKLNHAPSAPPQRSCRSTTAESRSHAQPRAAGTRRPPPRPLPSHSPSDRAAPPRSAGTGRSAGHRLGDSHGSPTWSKKVDMCTMKSVGTAEASWRSTVTAAKRRGSYCSHSKLRLTSNSTNSRLKLEVLAFAK